MGTSHTARAATRRAAQKEIAGADGYCAKRHAEQPVEQEKTVWERGDKMTDAEFIRRLVKLVHGEHLTEAIDIIAKDKGYQMEAIAKRLEDDEWQPIETAPPKDAP
jgi:hypothetical protein